MAKDNSANDYEEARKQRVLDNSKRFEELGILSISKSLADISKTERKPERRGPRPKPSDVYMSEPRRSSRERNQVVSYRDDVNIDIGLRRGRGRIRGSNWDSNWATYLARPLEEVRVASYEEKTRARKSAEKLQSNLESDNPSFVKSMVRSHVYSCFWLGLPSSFCEQHLPKSTTDFVLEDEEGSEYEAVYISKRAGLSGGWRAFALEHKLDDGDALVFELVDETRFKVYIVRAFDGSNVEDSEAPEAEDDAPEKAKKQKREDRKKINSKSTAKADDSAEDLGDEDDAPKKAKKQKREDRKKKNSKKSTAKADDSAEDSGDEDDAPKKAKKQKHEESKQKNPKSSSKADDPAADSGRRRSARLK